MYKSFAWVLYERFKLTHDNRTILFILPGASITNQTILEIYLADEYMVYIN